MHISDLVLLFVIGIPAIMAVYTFWDNTRD